MVTRVDVAQRAGVSTAVVSYVVNNGPRPVAPKTRAKVEAAIAELGYRPNVHAAALKGGRTRSVAVLLPTLNNPFYAEFAETLGGKLYEMGYQLSVSIVDFGTAREREVVSSIIDHGADAIVFSSSESAKNANDLVSDRVKSILFDSESEIPGVLNVTSKNTSLSAAAVRYLHSFGHTLVGVVAGQRYSPQSTLRIEGWRQEQLQGNYPCGPELVVHSETDSAGAFESVAILLDPDGPVANRYGRRPTSLVVFSDVQAFGVLLKCAQLGIKIPEDLEIVSIDGTQSARFSTPPLTTIRQPLEYMSSEIVALVTGEREAAVFNVHSNLVVGGTTTNQPLDLS